MRVTPALAVGLWLFLVTLCFAGAVEPPRTEANVPVELTFISEQTASAPASAPAITLDVVFVAPDGSQRRVPAFFAGEATWKVRYASPTVGIHRWRSECQGSVDPTMHDRQGEVEVMAYRGDNPLYRHGPIRVAEDRRHFAYADGTPFFWLGDTWWMGLTRRLEWPANFQTLAADRRAKGFNVVQIVAGLYPDMPAFDDRGANEAGFPWEPDYRRLRPDYFNAADRRIAWLVEQGLVPCIVGGWGYHLPWLGADNLQRHWREIIARWGAYPVVWCAAGETTMPYYLSATKAADADRQKREWTDIIRYLRATDPFHRLVTCHPSQTARTSVTDPAVLDFDMQQTGHGSPAGRHADLARQGWDAEPSMPVISGESRYEALEIRPTLTAREAREAFWAHLVNSGCAGHTYGANGIWQVNRRGQPYGNSPGGNNWGTTPWDDAMRLPGSTQLSLARRFLDSMPWHRFTPQPDSATWAESDPLPVPGDWIWYPEGDPRRDAPVASRFFRKTFELPANVTVQRARFRVAADDRYAAWINGRSVGAGGGWQELATLDAIPALRPGRNVLAIRAENVRAPVTENPAGLAVGFSIGFSNSSALTISSDATWRTASNAPDDWYRPDFPDQDWVPARVIAKPGDGPWGMPGKEGADTGPWACGIGEQLRLLYALEPRNVIVRQLRPSTEYEMTAFDPVTGQRRELGARRSGPAGEIAVEAPDHGHDWVLLLALP